MHPLPLLLKNLKRFQGFIKKYFDNIFEIYDLQMVIITKLTPERPWLRPCNQTLYPLSDSRFKFSRPTLVDSSISMFHELE